MKTILLTGATGFVGQQVVNVLKNYPVKLRIILREPSIRQSARAKNVEHVIQTQDLFAQTEQWWQEACCGVDIIIHLAWYAEPGEYLHSAKNIDCLRGSLTLARGASLAGVSRFIGIGTCYEYDVKQGSLSVTTALKPESLYASTKAATFLTLQQWFAKQNIEFLWCRLFFLHGKNEDPRRLSAYIHSRLSSGQVAELTSGEQIRDFMSVEDAACAIVEKALSNEQGAVNICSGKAISVRQFAEQIADQYGRRDLLNFGARKEDPFSPPYVIGIG